MHPASSSIDKYSRPSLFLTGIIAVIMLLLPAHRTLAQVPSPLAGQNNFRTFSITEGLPQSNVYSLLQDQQGYIWAGTDGGGLCRFDGQSFKTFTKDNGLSGNTIRKIYEDSRGWLWIGTNGGISIYDGWRFRTVSQKDSLSGSTVISLYEDQQQRLWAGTDDGGVNIIEYLPSKDTFSVQTITDQHGLNSQTIFDIYQDDEGRIWLATLFGGIHILTPNAEKEPAFDIEVLYQGIDIPSDNILCIEPGKDGDLWFGTYDAGLFKIKRNPEDPDARQVVTYPPLKAESVWDILFTPDQTLWIATGEGGLMRFRQGRFTAYTEKNGLPTNQINVLLQTRDNHLWIGTNGDGFCQFIGPHFAHFTVDNGLDGDNVYAIQQDSSYRFWIATMGGGIANFHFDTVGKPVVQNLSRTDGLSSNNISDIAIGNPYNKNVWIGTVKDGIVSYDGTSFTAFTEKDGLSNNRINKLLIDRKGHIWIGTASGISKFDGRDFFNLSMEEMKIDKDGVKDIIQNQRGHIWFATAGGIARYKGDSVLTTFDEEEGLMHPDVNTVTEGPGGNIWIGTNGGGLYRFDTGSKDSIPIHFVANDSLLTSNVLNSLQFYDATTLIIGTEKGFDKVRFDEALQIKKVRHYNASDGFWGVECNNNAIYRDHEHNIWLGTVKGLTRYNPALEPDSLPPPLTHIVNLKLFFKEVDWQHRADSLQPWSNLPHSPELPYHENHLTFYFTGIAYNNPEKVRYQYQLTGWDNGWSPPSAEQHRTYSGLSPGRYTFKVRAVNAEGQWSPQPATFSFVIHPPWWQTWWFYGVSLFLILLGIYGYMKFRERKLRKEKQVLEKRVEERTKEVVQQKDEIEQQKTVIEAKNKDIMDSINYASRIQNAILPREDKQQALIENSFIFFKPKDVVSGDFYWMEKKDSKVLFTAADCTGHGVPGAFMSMICTALLNEAVNEKGIWKPNKVFDEVRKGIIQALKQTGKEGESQDGMDAALCMLDKKKGELMFSGANNPLYLIRHKDQQPPPSQNGAIEPKLEAGNYVLYEIAADPQPIGYYKDGGNKPFTAHKLTVRKGDTLYLFSDGYPDQFGGPKGKKFMYKRFKKLLLSIQSKDMSGQYAHLEKTLDEWINDPGPYNEPPDQIDDILVLGVRL